MLIVKCPRCFKNQRCNPMNIANARKRCVYCGRSFKVKDRIIKQE